MKNLKLHIFYLLIICFILNSCIEPFEFETVSFENALVVEATITNEFKYQEIILTRTFEFEKDMPAAETNAVVSISDDTQLAYNFNETTPGKYVSTSQFSAEPSKIYKLTITTNDGKKYESSASTLPQSVQLEDIRIEGETTKDGMEGVTIYANSFDPTGNARYYRYEYEETYKILAILWSPFDAVLISDRPPFTDIDRSIQIQPRTQEERICFNTLSNTEIMQIQTTGLQEDRVSQFPIRFIANTDPILRERYSILIRQYIQSQEAFNYYKVLNELSGSESLLSQNQPGFVNGNITATDNSEEKVLGFFEVTSVSSKRIFFNFRDNFPDENRPFYYVDCEFVAPLFTDPSNLNISPLVNLLKTNDFKFFERNIEGRGDGGPYLMIQRPCGDCTALGSNIKPDFWID